MSHVHQITLRVSHHAGASGYDQLAEMMKVNSIATISTLNLFQRVLARGGKSWIKNSGSVWYHRDNFVTEMEIARHWLRSCNQVFHFLYGENSYRYSGLLKKIRRKNALMATYHTPPDRFQQVVTHDAILRRLDAVIVVSTLQQTFFSEKLGLDRVHYVPHGINTDYFSPKSDSRPDDGLFRCISVGSHLRDFETLKQAADIIGKADSNIRFTVIAAERYKAMFAGNNNVDVYSGVSDEELLKLYRCSDVLSLPLLDCTANNALLEGIACGLPVISTRLPAIHDYVDESCSVLVDKGDFKGFAETIVSLKSDGILLNELGRNSRARALCFDWSEIASQFDRIYQDYL